MGPRPQALSTPLPATIPASIPDTEAYRKVQELQAHVSMLALVLAATMLMALAGNIFLAFIFTKLRQRRLSPVQILILHNCAADICFVLFTAFPQMLTLTVPHFYGGDFLCRLVKYLQLIPMFASPYLLVAISVDRYVAICKPLLALRWKYRLVHTLAGAAWAASFCLSTPNIFAFGFEKIRNASVCTFQMNEKFEKAWIGVFSLIVWVVPTVIVAIMYSLVCVKVCKSTQRVRKYTESTSKMVHSNDEQSRCGFGRGQYHCSADFKYIVSTRSISLRRNFTPSINSFKVKTVKLTMTIVAANFILWAPFCVTNLIDTFFGMVQTDLLAMTCIMLVGNANSCVNPWIYVIFNYKRVGKLLCGSNHRQNDTSHLQMLSSSAEGKAATIRHKR